MASDRPISPGDEARIRERLAIADDISGYRLDQLQQLLDDARSLVSLVDWQRGNRDRSVRRGGMNDGIGGGKTRPKKRQLGDGRSGDEPRLNRFPAEIERKTALLEEPHIAPLTAFVRRLRAQLGEDSVPWFDPTDAGVEARILQLLQSPGDKAAPPTGSGFISPHNDDPTAENMWGIQRDIGIDRRHELVTWNVVPWYVPRTQTLREADFTRARPMLSELLGLLPELRVVVLFGENARRAWRRAEIRSRLPVLSTWHTSPLALNYDRSRRGEVIATLREARSIAGFE
jgi:uracil-DNA glycosylase